MKKLSYIFSFGAGDTVKIASVGLEEGGDDFAVIMSIATFDSTNNVTRTVTVKDRAENAVYSKASCADAAFTLDDTKKIVVERCGSVTVTLSGVPGNAGVDTVNLYVEGK